MNAKTNTNVQCLDVPADESTCFDGDDTIWPHRMSAPPEAVRLVAEAPHEANVDEVVPDSAHLEASRVLADEAEEALTARGFSDEEIREWAQTYLAEESSGDVDGLFAWIGDRKPGQNA